METATPKNISNLFGDLIWPAIAGNVAWAFITVAVQGNHDHHYRVRLLILGLVAGYVMIAWLRGEQKTKSPVIYRVLSGLMAAGIATFAIAVQADDKPTPDFSKWVNYSLAAICLVVGIGHFGIWNAYRLWSKRSILITANGIGIWLALNCPTPHSPDVSICQLPAAIIIVLAAWFIVWGLDELKVWPDRTA